LWASRDRKGLESIIMYRYISMNKHKYHGERIYLSSSEIPWTIINKNKEEINQL